jgi:eukaryotic-like serine/threonine-protein kinase
MVKATDVKLTPQIAAEICERTGSSAAVDGSITTLGNQYGLILRARNCRTADVLDEEQGSPSNKADVFKSLGQLTDRLRTRAARSLAPLEKEPSLPTEVTTSSLEAWRAYSAAMKSQQSNSAQNTEPISLLKRAIEIDPQFAMAYMYLGRTNATLGASELGAENIGKAYELRNRVSDPENFEITFNYHRQVTRNLELARQTLESWIRETPGNFIPHGYLAAFTNQGAGHYERAAEEGEKAIALVPEYAIGYSNVVYAYIYLNRLSDAEATLRKAAEHKIETSDFSMCRYFIAFLRGDQAAMAQEVSRRPEKLEAQGFFEQQEALTAAYHGRLREAARVSDRAVILSRQAGLRERAAQFAGSRAAWSALFGIRDAGQKSAAEALSLYRSRDADYGPAFALALLQDNGQAHKIAAQMEKLYPEDTSVQFSYLPALRAIDALNQRDPARALEMTDVAVPYDLAAPGTAFYTGAFFGALYPMYLRGIAYSRMGRHREAASEFQKILDHPGIMLNDPMGPMARLQLARALAAAGNRAKSAAIYRDLLSIWKDADPDIRVVQEASAEASKVQ